jgi:hypothetical protein
MLTTRPPKPSKLVLVQLYTCIVSKTPSRVSCGCAPHYDTGKVRERVAKGKATSIFVPRPLHPRKECAAKRDPYAV